MGLAILAGTAQDSLTRLPFPACASLQGLSIPASAIGLDTSGAVVQTAVPVAASDSGNANGDFCKVTGSRTGSRRARLPRG